MPPAESHTPRSESSSNGGAGTRLERVRLGRLGRRITLLFILSTGIAVLALLLMMAYSARRQIEDVRVLQSHMVLWTGKSLDGWFRELDDNLLAKAQNPALMDAPSAELQEHLNDILLRSPAFRSATLVDARPGRRGQEIMTLQGGRVITGTVLYGQEWFFLALERGGYISQIALVEGRPTFTVARSILEEGRPVGVIAAQADLDWGYAILERARTERGGYAYVMDRTGRPLLHDDRSLAISADSRVDVTGVYNAIMRQPLPYFYAGLNTANEPVLGAYYHLEEVDWIVFAEQPLGAVLREILPLAGTAGGVFLVGLAAIIVVALYIGRRVARPIAFLQQGARRIGSGELEHRISLEGRSELTNLADEFNRMAGNLRASQSQLEAWSLELEQRVDERTAELGQALQQLQHEAEVRETLLRTIREMSSPVIPVIEGIIVMPIVGTLDSERAQRVVEDLLAGIERERARAVILDITGLAFVDTAVANALIHAARAAQLLGAQPIVVGIAPAVAETLVQLGVEMHGLRTAATLQEGLRLAQGFFRRG